MEEAGHRGWVLGCLVLVGLSSITLGFLYVIRKHLSSVTHSCHHNILLPRHMGPRPWTEPSETMNQNKPLHSYIVCGRHPGTALIRITTTYRLVIKFKWVMGPRTMENIEKRGNLNTRDIYKRKTLWRQKEEMTAQRQIRKAQWDSLPLAFRRNQF